jgi:transposase
MLASSGRPLNQIAQELGIAASMLRSWRDAGDRGRAGSPRRPNTQAAIPPAGADLATENARLRRENERLRMGGLIAATVLTLTPACTLRTCVPSCSAARPNAFDEPEGSQR